MSTSKSLDDIIATNKANEAKKRQKALSAKKNASIAKKSGSNVPLKPQNGVKKEQARQPAAKKASTNGNTKKTGSVTAKRAATPLSARNVTIKVAPTKKQPNQSAPTALKIQKHVDPHKVVIRVRPSPTATTKTSAGERAKRVAVNTRDISGRREQVMQNARKPKQDSSLASRFATVSAR